MDKSNGAKCLRARRGSASSKDEPKAQKSLTKKGGDINENLYYNLCRLW